MYDWASDVFNKYGAIFLINLRNLKTQETLEQAIINQSPPLCNKKIDVKFMQRILESFRREILLLLDGYDELSEDVRKSENVIHKIIERKHYADIDILLTSRPQMAMNIGPHFTTKAEIKGFSRERAEEYIEKWFPEKPELCKSVMEFAGRNGERDTWEVPILLLFTCFLVDSGEIDISESTIPLDTMYQSLINCLFKRYYSKQDRAVDEEHVRKVIQRLGKIALDCLKNDSLAFDIEEITDLVDDHAFMYGIIIAEPDRRRISALSQNTRVVFIHRSIQEYLAAVYLAQSHLTANELPHVINDGLNQKYSLFTSIYDGLLQKTIKRQKMPGSDSQAVPSKEENAHRILCQKVAQNYANMHTVCITGYPITPASAKMFTQSLSSNDALVVLELKDLNLSHCLGYLCTGQMRSLQNLSFWHCVFQEIESQSDLISCSENCMPQLQQSSFMACEFQSEFAMTMLKKILCSGGNLHTLQISQSHLENKLCSFFTSGFDMLNTLSLSACTMQETDTDIESTDINLCQLETLSVSFCVFNQAMYTFFARCMATSMLKVNFQFKTGEKELDAMLFCQAYRTVSHMTVEGNAFRGLEEIEQMSKVETFNREHKKDDKHKSYGAFQCLEKLEYRIITIPSHAMKEMASSLIRNQTPLCLAFANSHIIDGMTYLGSNVVLSLAKLEISQCSFIENEHTPEVAVITNAFPNLRLLPERLAHYPNPFSERSEDIFIRCIAKNKTLTSICLPVTNDTLHVLLEWDLPAVRRMELHIRAKNEENSVSAPNNSECVRRFANLQTLAVYAPLYGNHKEKRLVKIQHQFFVALSGHGILQEVCLRGIDLTDCLGLLFAESLPSLERVNLEGCFLKEDRVNDHLEAFVGNLPSLVYFKIDPYSNTYEPSAVRFLLSCISGSESLQTLRFGDEHRKGSRQMHSDQVIKYINLKNCLIPLCTRRLHTLSFSHCILDEDDEKLLKIPGSVFPALRQIDLDSSNNVSNSAMKYLCKALAGSQTLGTLQIENIDMTDCLSLLLSQNLPSLSTVKLQHCTLNEDSAEPTTTKEGSLVNVRELDIMTCRKASNSAFKVICKALSSKKQNKKVHARAKNKASTGSSDTLDAEPLTKRVKHDDRTSAPAKLSMLREFRAIKKDLDGTLSLLLAGPLPNLVTFDVPGCQLNEKVSNRNVMGYLPNVCEIDLTQCESVSAHTVELLMSALSGNQVLRSFSVRGVDLTAANDQLLVENLPGLYKLAIKDCVLSASQADNFVQCREENFPTLQYLLINGTTGIGQIFATPPKSKPATRHSTLKRADIVSFCSGVLCIGMRGCGFPVNAIEDLANSLKEEPRICLRQLDIDEDLISDELKDTLQEHSVLILSM